MWCPRAFAAPDERELRVFAFDLAFQRLHDSCDKRATDISRLARDPETASRLVFQEITKFRAGRFRQKLAVGGIHLARSRNDVIDRM